MLVNVKDRLEDEQNQPDSESELSKQRAERAQVLKDEAVTFGRRVKALRQAAGLTQRQLAERLSEWGEKDYHQTTVAKLETGNRPTSLAELIPLAVALGVSQREFFEDPTPADRAEHKVRETEQELFRIKADMDLAFTRIRQLKEAFRKTTELYARRVASLHELDPGAAAERLQVVEDMQKMVESPEFNADPELERQERMERERERAEMIDAGEAEYQDHYPRID